MEVENRTFEPFVARSKRKFRVIYHLSNTKAPVETFDGRFLGNYRLLPKSFVIVEPEVAIKGPVIIKISLGSVVRAMTTSDN